MAVKSYRDLRMWQEAHALTVEIYRITRDFPQEERYGLTSQIRRAAVSVPANIAEGAGRRTSGEFIHFLGIARGSLQEVDYYLQLSADLAYASVQDLQPVVRRYRGLDAGMRACLMKMTKK